MKNTIILIGGLENKEEYINNIIIKETNKDKPNFLYIGFGNSYSESIYEKLKKEFRNLGCDTLQIKKKSLDHDINIAIERIKNADIIYLGGGDTIEQINTIKEYNLDNYLKEKENCVFVGVSAGAITLSKEGYSDSKILRKESNRYEFIKGLNFVNIIVSPHDDNIDKKKELMEDIDKKIVYGISNDSAIIIKEGKIINTIGIVNEISYKGEKPL